MSSPSSTHPFTIRPSGPGPLLFESAQYRYEFIHPLLEENDSFEPTAVARREPIGESGPRQLVLLRRVVLPPEEERQQRADEEVRLATALRHRHIARVFGLEAHEGHTYVVTEYVPGCLLATAQEAALLQGGNLSAAFAVHVAAQVAEALHHAYHCRDERGRPLHVVHRAVSPMRIHLGWDGTVKLGDFGVARSKLVERLSTPPKVLRADVAYSSPEVVDFQQVDGRADLFSLGMVLLEALTGTHPLDPPDVSLPPAESPEVMRYTSEVRVERPSWGLVGHLTERIRRFDPEDVERAARDVPEGLRRIVHKALRPHPDDRFQTGAEMRDALRDWLGSQGEPYGAEQVAAEMARFVREPPSFQEAGAFPTERGVILTPEEAALAEVAWRERKHRS